MNKTAKSNWMASAVKPRLCRGAKQIRRICGVSILLAMTIAVLFAMTIVVLFAMTTPADARECTSFKDLHARLEVETLPKEGPILVVEDFKNDTEQKADAWLSEGIPHLLKRYLQTSSGIGATRQTVSKPAYRIGGMFQHTQKWLRIFVVLREAGGKIIAQFTVETPFPLHKQFFTGLKEAALQILKKLEKEGDLAAMKKIENETNSVAAYQNTIQGRKALATYDPNQMEVALIWFQEARREDHQFVGAYEGLLDAYSFLLLAARHRGGAVSTYTEAIENTLQEMEKRTGQKIEPAEYGPLKSHIQYRAGQMAFAKGKPANAAQAFLAALEALPLDFASAYALSQSYDKLGKKKRSEKYRRLAERLRPCL